MAVYIGDTLIAGSFKSGASWEVGDVGISALGIDEALNKRRYLNGQVISQTQFVQFTAMLKSRVSVYPNLSTTEVNWQAEVTNSKLGQCGKFVIDDVAGTIRLPKVVNINGLQNLTGLGGIKAESLPNIKGESALGSNAAHVGALSPTGAFVAGTSESLAFVWNGASSQTYNRLAFDASNSSSTYQDDAPVQQEAVQYPYFIQVAEGVETSVDVSREIELNNPFSLLDYKYSEYELGNASWLLSNGQFNSGATYPAVYSLLLAIYNGTTTKAGVSVKLSTEAYADTDFVLNTSDTTFRLPLKVALASGKMIVGNGINLGITSNNSNIAGLSWDNSIGLTLGQSISLPNNAGSSGVSITSGYGLGVTTDPLKSGIETSANGLYLYFYVGETVQDANIIAAASVLTDMTNLKNLSNISDNGTSTGASWAMPSNTYDDLTLGASNSTYTAPADGYFCMIKNSNTNNQYFGMYCLKDGETTLAANTHEYGVNCWTPTSGGCNGLLPIKKGRICAINYSLGGATEYFRFIYAKGSEWEKE